MITPTQFLANLTDLVTEGSSVSAVFVIIGVLSYIIGSVFLGRIFSKGGQPFAAAFVPIWNVIVFFRLGGYSGLWIIGALIGYAYVGVTMVAAPVALLSGAEWVNSGFMNALDKSSVVLLPVFGFLFISSAIIALLSAYNIGRAFEKDAGYLLLFVFLYPVWVIALAFTSYDWDEDSANPNSVGQRNRTQLRKDRAKELAISREKARRFLEPNAPVRNEDEEPESDYDRALREQEARGGIPKIKEKKVRKKKDSGDAKIVDSGSTGANTDDATWF